MSGLKQFWQNLIERLRPRVPWSADGIGRELSVARQERQQLLSRLSELQAEVERGVSAGQREQQNLLGQLKALHGKVEQELAAAGLEKQELRGELTGLRSEVERGLEAARQEQQVLLGQLNGLHSEVDRGFASMREEQHGLGGRLDGLHSEVEHGLEAARQEQQGLLGQLGGLHLEVDRGFASVREEQHGLSGRLDGLHSEVEHGLEAAHQARQGLVGRLDGLQAEVAQGLAAVHDEERRLQGQLDAMQADVEREFSTAREQRQDLLGQLGNLQGELQLIRGRDEALRAELRKRFEQIQIERDATNQDIVVLRNSLAEADARQASTGVQVNSLETRLAEQRQEHDVALQQTFIRERRLGRRLTAAMTVATAAFVLGVVGGAISFWQTDKTTRLLAEVSQGVRDIQATIAAQSSSVAPVPPPPGKAPAVPKDRGTPDVSQSRPPSAGNAAPEKEDAGPEATGQQLPPPDFITSRSLPQGDYNFKLRQDARAFFEENAKQPGVVTLEDGLQYRELIPGKGRTPAAGDQVVIEYRTFRPDGTEMDGSLKEDLPTTFKVSEAIPALKETLLHMQEGAQWELYIPANLAYRGTRRRGPSGFEPLILTVELISIQPASPAAE